MKISYVAMISLFVIFQIFQALRITTALAGCEVVEGAKKSPFDGNSLAGLQVEKKSLVTLNKAYPGLNVIEKAFKGEAQTCTSCTDKHITCSAE